MAFQSALDALSSTIHRDTASAPIAEVLSNPIRDSLDLFPYHLTDEKLDLLTSIGINASCLGPLAHPHPAHKSIENHLLHRVWSHYAATPSTVSFMKPQKFNKLKHRNPNFDNLQNYRITPADTVRYPETSPHLPKNDTLFLHDAIMYMSPADIADLFLRSEHLEKVFASLVVPPESSFTDRSFYPSLYTYRIESDRLYYCPEGNPASSYNQPSSAIEWLKITTIHCENLSLSVTLLDSFGPCHSLLIQRGLPSSSTTEESKSFKIPDCVLLPAPNSLSQETRDRLVPTRVYHSLFQYVRAVRTLRESDPCGFVRTQSNKPEYSWVTDAAWNTLQSFALQTFSAKPNSEYGIFNSTWARFKSWVRLHSLRLQCFATIPAIVLAVSAPFALKWVLDHKITSLVICRKTLISTPTCLPQLPHLPVRIPLPLGHSIAFSMPPPFAPKPPLFNISFGPNFREFIGPCFRPLIAAMPKIFKHFGPRKTSLPVFKIALALISVPATLISTRIFLGPDSPQQMHDRYQRYFHPKAWELILTRRPVYCPRGNFLPGVPLLAHDDSPPRETSLRAPIPIPQTPIQSTPDTQERPSTQPPLPTEVGKQPSVAEPVKPTSEPAPSNWAIIPPSSENSAPMLTKLDTPGEAVTEESLLDANSNPIGQVGKPDEPAPDALMEDPSAFGPSAPFNTLHPGPYTNFGGCFTSRLRHNQAANLPVPNLKCLLTALSQASQVPEEELWATLCRVLPNSQLDNSEVRTQGLSTDHLTALCSAYNWQVNVLSGNVLSPYGMDNSIRQLLIHHTPGSPGHFWFKPITNHPEAPPPLQGAQRSEGLKRLILSFRSDGHLLPIQKIHTYTTAPSRAKNLASNMKNGFDGVMANLADPSGSSRDRLLALDSIADLAAPKRVDLIHIAGFAGCGKTRPIQQLLLNPAMQSFKVAVPTVELRNEWKRDLDLPSNSNWRMGTWETSLLKSARILVIDEVYKMPRGYLDLSLIADPSIELVILLGDPIQGEYHSTHPSSSNHLLSSEVVRLSKFIDFYCFWSYRIPKKIASLFKLPSRSNEQGVVRQSRQIPRGRPILTASQNTAKTLVQCGHRALTISSSQGSTFRQEVTIHLDRNVPMLSASHSLVAITRSTVGVCFVGDFNTLSGSSSANLMFSSLSKHCSGMSSTIDLLSLFPVLQSFNRISAPLSSRRSPLLHGASTLAKFDMPRTLTPRDEFDVLQDHRRSGDLNAPQVDTTFLPPTRRPLHADLQSCINQNPNPTSDIPPPTPFEPAYPGIHFESFMSSQLETFDPQAKEILFKHEWSKQFLMAPEDHSISWIPFQTAAARHNPKLDQTLLPASIEKRLRFRPTSSPYRITSKDEVLGGLLFESWAQAYGISCDHSERFDEQLFLECIALNEYAQLSNKAQSVIMANANRSDPDWRWSAVRIFAKAQHKVNDSSIFGNWKACQTLALMHDAVVLFLGPVKKYQRIKLKSHQPRRLFIHSGTTPHDLSDWCSQNFKPSKLHTANDYTAFDQSQHGEAVVLERKKMEMFNIPNHLIELHIHLKTNVSTQFGPLTCMRLTGEPGTYDDNTDYNIAVLNAQHDLRNRSYLVSGDDSVINGVPPEKEHWPQIKELLALKFKTEQLPHPLFCGYFLHPVGSLRSPRPLCFKLAMAIDDKSLPDKLLSYLSEFAVGHSLGDQLWETLPVEQVSFQAAAFDFFCRHCSPIQKVALKIGTPFPHEILDGVSWASHATYSLMNSAQREFARRSKTSRRNFNDPEVSALEGDLRLTFNHDMTSPRLTGGLNITSQASTPPAPPNSPVHAGQMSHPVAPFGSSSRSDDDRLERPPPLPAQVSNPMGPGPAPVRLPFQFAAFSTDGTAQLNSSLMVASSSYLIKLAAHHRFARLTHLEAKVVPFAPAMTTPVTIRLVWTTADVSFDALNIMTVYGATAIVAGGPIGVVSHNLVPADLNSLNSVVKDSVLYTNTPKLHWLADKAENAKSATILAGVIISGELELSIPINIPATSF